MTEMFSSRELSEMREAQTGHMMDTCIISRYSAVQNTVGEMIATYTDDAAAIICGLEMKSGFERKGSENTVVVYDAIIRLPITTTINQRDRIKILTRFDETISSYVYEIVSPIQRGASGIRILAKKYVV